MVQINLIEGMDCELILGSKSPRRQQLLKLLNVPFRVLTAETHEHFDPDWSPETIVTELALRKGREIKEIYNAEIERDTLLCADTIVVIDGQILNKPQSKSDAAGMLGRLQGRTHSVFTGFSILTPSKEICDFEETRVTFSEMSQSEIAHYIDVAQPYDKAGSYGIQDNVGACFIEKINGCYYNVVGLPVAKLYKTFKSLNLI